MDKNGKLFGKINIIDLLVILVAVAAAVMVGLKMSGKFSTGSVEVGTSIVYTVKVENVDAEVYENIAGFIAASQSAGAPGDRLMASGELLSGYITAVAAEPRSDEAQVTTGSGTLYIAAGKKDKVDLVFTIEAQVANDVTTEVGTQEVRVGKTHIVKTTHFELSNGVITSCEWAGGTGADRVLG